MVAYGYLLVNLLVCLSCSKGEEEDRERENVPYDGWYNNLQHPSWGATDTILLRRSKYSYADGVYTPAGRNRPDPISISRAVHQGPMGRPSAAGRTAMLVYFGQQVVEEIVDAQRRGCPIEYFNIPVPSDHPTLNPEGLPNLQMPFMRTRYDQTTGHSPNNPRQQLNEITPYLDGQVIYGPNKAWTDAIRAFRGGRLAGTNPGSIVFEFPPNNTIRLPFNNPPVTSEHKLKPVSRFQAIGNPRGHENPFLLSFGILWFRWHNFIADQIRRKNSSLTDEQIFNRARRRVIAHYQKLVFYDWLPRWLDSSKDPSLFRQNYPYTESGDSARQPRGTSGTRRRTKQKQRQKKPGQNASMRLGQIGPLKSELSGYEPKINPGINHEFQVAAMRFGHTLVPPGLWRRSGAEEGCTFPPREGRHTDKQYAAMRLCNEFWNSRETVEEDIDAIIRGMATTLAEREDSIIVPDLSESLFGPLEFSRRDLAAINIQRGRDHGLADYNSVREAYGFQRKRSWEDINRKFNIDEIKRLKALYSPDMSAPDDVDLFTGGMLETTPDGPGELFQAIILEQFLRIRHGDRFWFENVAESGLTQEELKIVWDTDLRTIIAGVTGVRFNQVQHDVFMFNHGTDDTGCRAQPDQLTTGGKYDGLDMLEPCSPLRRYDYFSGSEVSFAVTFSLVVLSIPATILLMYLLAWRRRNSLKRVRILPKPLQASQSTNPNEIRVLEWVGFEEPDRIVYIKFEAEDKKINVYNTHRVLLRYVDVALLKESTFRLEVHLSSDKPENVMALKLKEYDLVMKFFNQSERDRYLVALQTFLDRFDIKSTPRSLVESYILRNAVTKKHRQMRLNKFFKNILSVFDEGGMDIQENIYGPVEVHNDHASTTHELSRIELTQAEFGEAFGLKPNSTFVKHMFLLADSTESGHVSFKEFMDMFILLTSDDIDSKVRLLFSMYDLNHQGYLTQEDIHNMVKSLLDLSENNVSEAKITEFTEALYKAANLRSGEEMTYADFKRVFTSDQYASTLRNATLELNAEAEDQDSENSPFLQVPKPCSKMLQRRFTLVRGYSIPGPVLPERSISQSSTINRRGTANYQRTTSRVRAFADEARSHRKPRAGLRDYYARVIAHLETYRLQTFWVTLYFLVTAGIFAERAHFYALERENGGLRRICGHGVTMSRGSASVIMFTYSCLMVTMCKNTITFLRETFFHRFIPFDSIHSFHKLIGCLSLVFTIVHIIFHGSNLYHICTQPAGDLTCYFREYYRATHELASFQYWAFATTTGITGIVLTVMVVVLFVFAMPYARRHVFHAFWNTHKLYIPIYIFLILHGSARMVQTPHFPYYILGPAILFTIDKVISMSRTKVELTVVKAELLPSGVTALKIKKPQGFEYLSGQWAQVACVDLGVWEFHPLTMTSSPHEKYLTFHIRAVGPWTNNLRRVYDPSNRIGKTLPKIVLDGPFGEGHQDWYKFEVSVLIGGGIGVTPFVSILKDIVHKTSMEVDTVCKKVYFMWVTRTQKQFEWVTDIVRDLEAQDSSKMVDTHIFVTEIKSKFDVRTTMLYVCERHFQKIAGKSLFTGLEATTHFGRPKFFTFLESLKNEHPYYVCERHFQKIAGKSLFTGLKATTHFGRPKFFTFLESLKNEHPYYVCERHFQKIAGKSLFTGLKATTHFGRPKFFTFLESLKNEHPYYVCERHFQKIAGKSLFTGLEATTHFGRPKFFTFLESLKNEHPYYVCERHFQKIAGKSLFTGLEATTHFGRPKFFTFLESLKNEHPYAKRIGVFSCGPRPMTAVVESACATLNEYKCPTYFHHYENF